MDRLLLAGFGLNLLGAIVVTLADTWLSRLLLNYFDAVEGNLANVSEAVRIGGKHFAITGVDIRRDGRLDTARSLKTLGWLTMVLGLGIQFAVAVLAKPSG